MASHLKLLSFYKSVCTHLQINQSLIRQQFALFTLHFPSSISFTLTLFSSDLRFLWLWTPVFLVAVCSLWFADREGRQRSQRVTWDKSCFSVLRGDFFFSYFCSLQTTKICHSGFEMTFYGRGGRCPRTQLPSEAEVKMTLPCEEPMNCDKLSSSSDFKGYVGTS